MPGWAYLRVPISRSGRRAGHWCRAALLCWTLPHLVLSTENWEESPFPGHKRKYTNGLLCTGLGPLREFTSLQHKVMEVV